jgi:malonyl-CoA O-methyltransferase
MINLRDQRRRLDLAADSIDAADFVQRASADGLFERLEPMRVAARHVVNLGCGTGLCSARLKQRFPGSRIINLDLSAAMLRRARARRSWFSSWSSRNSEIQCDAARLPLADDTVDLVFANMLFPYLDDVPGCLQEVSRVLRTDGLFLFATLGPDSFKELREAWQAQGDDQGRVMPFPDMHVIGDAMVANQLRDPVLDVDYIDINYRDLRSLYRDLSANAARNVLAGRTRSLGGRANLRYMEKNLTNDAGEISLRMELVYGHAWGGQALLADAESYVDAASIGRRRHSSS